MQKMTSVEYVRRLQARLAEVADRRELEALAQGKPVPETVREIRALIAEGSDEVTDPADARAARSQVTLSTGERQFVDGDRPEWCDACRRHIGNHYGGIEYRCDPRSAETARHPHATEHLPPPSCPKTAGIRGAPGNT